MPLNHHRHAPYWPLKGFPLSQLEAEFFKGLDIGQAEVIDALTRHGEHAMGYQLQPLASLVFPPYEALRHEHTFNAPWLKDPRTPGFRTADSVAMYLLAADPSGAPQFIRWQFGRLLSIAALWAEDAGEPDSDGKLRAGAMALFDNSDGPLRMLASYARGDSMDSIDCDVRRAVVEVLVEALEHSDDRENQRSLAAELHSVDPYQCDALAPVALTLKTLIEAQRIPRGWAATLATTQLHTSVAHSALEMWAAVARFNYDRQLEARLADSLSKAAMREFAKPRRTWPPTDGTAAMELIDLAHALDHLSQAGRSRVRRNLRRWVAEEPAARAWVADYLRVQMSRQRRQAVLPPGYARSNNPI